MFGKVGAGGYFPTDNAMKIDRGDNQFLVVNKGAIDLLAVTGWGARGTRVEW
jgi:hypothetical protein